MAKKKSGNLGLILKVVVVALGIAAFCMAFLTCVKYVYTSSLLGSETEVTFSGFQTMFGHTETTESVLGNTETKYLAFSFMATLAFFLPLVGAALSFVNNKIVKLVGAALMIVGAVLIFLVPQFAVLATVDGELTLVTALLDAGTKSIGVGAILGGIFAALGGAVAGYAALTNK